MVMVGGITRLTQSGLSMVTWKPITGWLPPLSEHAWQAAFDEYKNFPQYQQVFQDMTLVRFKEIFFWEYVHRIWGRIIGILFFVPWVYFVIRRRMSRRFIKLTFIAFILGGLQGLVGWWMVKSGLVDNPSVSHFRLATHLSLALGCACYVLWLALMVFPGPPRQGRPSMQRWTIAFILLLALQIVYGAFMAGTRAGHMYQTFPGFNGVLVPEQSFQMVPLWTNFFSNVYLINFVHRSLGWVVFIAGIFFAIKSYLSAETVSQRNRSGLLVGLLSAQFILGVMVVLAPGVPPILGVAHQIGALCLLAGSVALLHSFSNRET
jgi:cytochrome c oxidase assembly protein subunit 15